MGFGRGEDVRPCKRVGKHRLTEWVNLFVIGSLHVSASANVYYVDHTITFWSEGCYIFMSALYGFA